MLQLHRKLRRLSHILLVFSLQIETLLLHQTIHIIFVIFGVFRRYPAVSCGKVDSGLSSDPKYHHAFIFIYACFEEKKR